MFVSNFAGEDPTLKLVDNEGTIYNIGSQTNAELDLASLTDSVDANELAIQGVVGNLSDVDSAVVSQGTSLSVIDASLSSISQTQETQQAELESIEAVLEDLGPVPDLQASLSDISASLSVLEEQQSGGEATQTYPLNYTPSGNLPTSIYEEQGGSLSEAPAVACSGDGRIVVAGNPEVNSASVLIAMGGRCELVQTLQVLPDPGGSGFGYRAATSRDGRTVAIVTREWDVTQGLYAINVFRYNASSLQYVKIGQEIFAYQETNPFNPSNIWIALSGDGNTLAYRNTLGVIGEGTLYLRVARYNESTDNWDGISSTEPFPFQNTTSMALSHDGNIVVAGFPDENEVHVYQYSGSGTSWSQRGTTISTGSGSFGYSVDCSRDANVVVIGAPLAGAGGQLRIAIWDGSDYSLSSAAEESQNGEGNFAQTVRCDEGGLSVVVSQVNTLAGDVLALYNYDTIGGVWISVLNGAAMLPADGVGTRGSFDVGGGGCNYVASGGAVAGRLRVQNTLLARFGI